MLSNLIKFFTPENKTSEKYLDLVEKIKNSNNQGCEHRKLSDYEGNGDIADLNSRELCEFVVAASNDAVKEKNWNVKWKLSYYVNFLLARNLPFTHDEISHLLQTKIQIDSNYGAGIGRINKVVEKYLAENELTDELKYQINALIKSIEEHYQTAETRKWIAKLKELSGETSLRNPLVAGESWTDSALADIAAMDNDVESAWL